MTDDKAKSLGLLALAAGFRWAPGCLTGIDRVRVSWVDDYAGGVVDGDARVRPKNAAIGADDWPDFRDPATLGVLLAQVREAMGEPVHTAPCDDGAGGVEHWRAWPFADLSRYWSGSTEAAALVAALESA